MTKVQIQNNKGEEIAEVEVQAKKNLLTELTSHNIDIPNACGIGICGACLCTIKKGHSLVQKNMKGEPAFPLGEDEVMTCIAGVEESPEKIILETMGE